MLDQHSTSRAFLFMAITGVAIALSFLLPFLHVLEILFIAFVLASLVLYVGEVVNRLDFHYIKQQWRHINFHRFKNRRPPYPHDRWTLN